MKTLETILNISFVNFKIVDVGRSLICLKRKWPRLAVIINSAKTVRSFDNFVPS